MCTPWRDNVYAATPLIYFHMSTLQILLFKYIIEFKDRSSVVTMRVKIVPLTMTRYESFVVNVSTNGRKIKSILF